MTMCQGLKYACPEAARQAIWRLPTGYKSHYEKDCITRQFQNVPFRSLRLSVRYLRQAQILAL